MAGYDPRDPASVDVPVPDYLAAIATTPTELRLGVDVAAIEDDVDPEIANAVMRAIDTLRQLGANVVPVRLPDSARSRADRSHRRRSPLSAIAHAPLARRLARVAGMPGAPPG